MTRSWLQVDKMSFFKVLRSMLERFNFFMTLWRISFLSSVQVVFIFDLLAFFIRSRFEMLLISVFGVGVHVGHGCSFFASIFLVGSETM